MARRFNYTGRKSLSAKDVTVRLIADRRAIRFDVEFSGLSAYRLDAEASVHVEAYRTISPLWKRFDFGKVGLIRAPDDLSLSEFGRPEGILFRVKVTANGAFQGQLLAEADAIRPQQPDEEPSQAAPIIDIVPGPLGEELWRVDFDGPMPTLVVNEKLDDWKGLVREPMFRCLVTPAVLRQVLLKMLIIDCEVGESDDPTDWRTKWITFAESMPGVGNVPDLSPTDRYSSVTLEWIDSVVEAFADRTATLSQVRHILNTETAS